jgi:hypothetical protein
LNNTLPKINTKGKIKKKRIVNVRGIELYWNKYRKEKRHRIVYK